MAIQKINSADFQSKVLSAKGKCVVDFSAVWCGPCRMLAPILDEIAEEREDIAFYNVDVDESGDLAAKYGVMSVPPVSIFDDGEEKAYFIGLKSKEDILRYL